MSLFYVVAFVAGILLLIVINRSLVYIPNNRVGVMEKLVSGKGSVRSGLIALEGEAGFQPNVLRGGWHFLKPFQYRVHKMPLVTIPQGEIGYIFARDGQPLPPTQTLASNLRAHDFQDAAAFLRAGGQKGPQRMILREGTYAINLAMFVVLTRDHLYYLPLDRSEEAVFAKMGQLIGERDGYRPVIIRGAEDRIGIITVHDGPAVPAGEIIAPLVGNDPAQAQTYHNSFQDPDKFLLAGGQRGRQLQVLVEGTYYINRLFATEELVAKTVVEVGTVGVVVSYTGDAGRDLSGKEYKHGELVAVGERGVWSEPLLPGKYAFNTVQSNQGKAEYARSQQQASQIQILAAAEAEKVRIMAEGEAKKIRLVGESEADRAARVGVAQALALEEQVRAYGGPQFQLVQQVMSRFAEAIEKTQAEIVPKIQMATDGKGGGGSLVENLLTLLLSGKLTETIGLQPTLGSDPQAETLRSELRRSLQGGQGGAKGNGAAA